MANRLGWRLGFWCVELAPSLTAFLVGLGVLRYSVLECFGLLDWLSAGCVVVPRAEAMRSIRRARHLRARQNLARFDLVERRHYDSILSTMCVVCRVPDFNIGH